MTTQTVGHAGKGDFTIGADGRITRGPETIYGGIQILKTDLLAEVEDSSFSLNILWNKMLARNSLFGLRYPGKWCDVGHPEGIKMAEDMLDAADV